MFNKVKQMSKTIGIRLDEKIDEQIDEMAKSMNINKSQLMRRAFTEWARMREGVAKDQMMINDIILISSLFEFVKDDNITEIAERIANHTVSKIKVMRLERGFTDESVDSFLVNFTRMVGPDHFGWYTKFDYSVSDDEKITIYGFHSINHLYSRYSVEFVSNVINKLGGYHIIEDSISLTENSFIFEMKK